MEPTLRPPPKIRGLDFAEDELTAAKREDRLLVLGLFTRNTCNLRCGHCYTGMIKQGEGALSTEAKCRLVDQAIDLGARTVYVAGAGEPLLDKGFWPLAEYVVERRGLDLVLYTNNTMVTKDVARRLRELGVSVFSKYCSPDPVREAAIMGVPLSLASRVAGGRERLLEEYAAESSSELRANGNEVYRLGIETVIARQNRGDVASLWCWARSHHVVPFMETLIDFSDRPHDPRVEYRNMQLSEAEIDRVFGELLAIDEMEFGYTWTPQRPFAATKCHRLDYNLVIDENGFAFPCSQDGWKELNVRDYSLSRLWSHPGLRTIRDDPELRRIKCGSCPNLPPDQYRSRFHLLLNQG